ncbi:MAG: flagellar hook capping protein [Epsilonproteobacteria bacterium]|nr:flagellar hook capping protein [Campylobacterota bacterium]
MDVTNTLNTPTSIPTNDSDIVSNPDGILDKDDFLELLLIELQYQDPTDPMDTDKILSQTSELASLEASTNTNKALEDLSKTLTETSGMSIVSAIGKMGSLGTNSIVVGDEGSASQFDLYFADDVSSGVITIKDVDGNTVRTFDIAGFPQGVQTFSWDGTDENGAFLGAGTYYVEADYTTPDGQSKQTAVGVYPIESVRFDSGEALLKMGSQYYTLDQVKEIYEG